MDCLNTLARRYAEGGAVAPEDRYQEYLNILRTATTDRERNDRIYGLGADFYNQIYGTPGAAASNVGGTSNRSLNPELSGPDTNLGAVMSGMNGQPYFYEQTGLSPELAAKYQTYRTDNGMRGAAPSYSVAHERPAEAQFAAQSAIDAGNLAETLRSPAQLGYEASMSALRNSPDDQSRREGVLATNPALYHQMYSGQGNSPAGGGGMSLNPALTGANTNLGAAFSGQFGTPDYNRGPTGLTPESQKLYARYLDGMHGVGGVSTL